MFKNIKEIEKAVHEGKKVFWKNPAYQIKKYSNGIFIVCSLNNSITELTEQYNINDFHYGE